MENRILEVFYGTDGKPYKDQERSVLFPVVGNEYQGANDFTHIRFYYQRLCGEDNTLVAVFKNAKGQLGSRPLSTSTDSTRNEKYALLPISDFLTQYKGDIYIALQCYRGDADAITWDSVNNMWVLNTQVPTIRSTANIKMSVNYAPLIVGGGGEELLTLQVLLSYIAEKSDIDDVVIVFGDISGEDLSGYEVGQLFYDNDTHTYYQKTDTSPYYTKALSGAGVLGAPHILCRSDDDTRTIAQLHTIYGDSAYIVLRYLNKDYLYFSKKTNSTYTCVAFDTEEQRFYKASGLSGSALPSTMLIPANKIEIASKAFLLSNYVPYTGANRDISLGGHYIYGARVNNDHAGVNHDTYKEDDYKLISNIDLVLNHSTEIENNKIDDYMYAYFLNENATLICGGLTYKKLTENENDLIYACLNGSIAPMTDGTSITLGRVVKISKTSENEVHAYTENDLTIDLYSKDQAKAKFANDLALSIDNTTFVLTAKLKNANGADLATRTIDLPLESIVSSATYYDTYTYEGVAYTKVIVITLSTTSVPTIVPVGDLISGLEKEACVEIDERSGTFTQEQMQTLALDNASIKFIGRIYHKVTDTFFNSVEVIAEQEQGQWFNYVLSYSILVTPSTRAYQYVENFIQVYNKDEINTIVQGLQDGIDANAHDIDTLEGDVQDLEEKKANKDGRYETLTSGLAMNLDTKVVDNDKSAYLFRPTGGLDTECGNICKEKAVIGGTVVFNQLAKEINGTNWSVSGSSTYTFDNGVVTIASNGAFAYPQMATYISVPANHKILLVCEMKCDDVENFGGFAIGGSGIGYDEVNPSTSWKLVSQVKQATGDLDLIAYARQITARAGDTFYVRNAMLFDLTQMFGSAIADYIYSLEQANAGSGVAWFKRYFPKTYYAYNSGELVSVKTQGKKITHFNQWDEEWELGNISSSTGEVTSGGYIVSKNFIKVISSSAYCFKHPIGVFTLLYFYDNDKNFIGEYDLISTYDAYNTFTIPQNAGYMKFVHYHSAYNHDICINFHYDGERDGEYEPYESETYHIEDIELRGMPKTDLQGNLYFEGDEYAYDGSVKRKYGIVDLGTLTWNYNSSATLFNATLTDGKTSKNLICKLYQPYELSGGGNDPDMCMFVYNGTLYITNSNYTNPQTFATAMSGVYLVYELETPTDETATPFAETQECDNWGTEEYIDAHSGDVEMPVGHDTDYPLDLKSKLEIMPNSPSTDGVYVWNAQSGTNTLIPVATWLTDNGYAKADTLPTKDSVGGTLRQLLAVKETLDFDNTAYVDLGERTWIIASTQTSGQNAFTTTVDGIKPASDNNTPAKILSSKCKTISSNAIYGQNDGIAVSTAGAIFIYLDSFKSYSASQVKEALKGILLAFEKAS